MVRYNQPMTETISLTPYRDTGLFSLKDVADQVHMNRTVQTNAVKRGAIIPADKRGKNNRYLVTREEAMFILAVGAVALAAGLAVITLLESARKIGAKVGPDGVVIPFPAGAPDIIPVAA